HARAILQDALLTESCVASVARATPSKNLSGYARSSCWNWSDLNAVAEPTKLSNQRTFQMTQSKRCATAQMDSLGPFLTSRRRNRSCNELPFVRTAAQAT